MQRTTPFRPGFLRGTTNIPYFDVAFFATPPPRETEQRPASTWTSGSCPAQLTLAETFPLISKSTTSRTCHTPPRTILLLLHGQMKVFSSGRPSDGATHRSALTTGEPSGGIEMSGDKVRRLLWSEKIVFRAEGTFFVVFTLTALGTLYQELSGGIPFLLELAFSGLALALSATSLWHDAQIDQMQRELIEMMRLRRQSHRTSTSSPPTEVEELVQSLTRNRLRAALDEHLRRTTARK